MAKSWIGRCLALCALVSGCAGAVSQPEPLTQLPARVETASAADEASFALVIETAATEPPAAGYRTQYVNALDWEVADGTLSNGDATIPTLTRTAAVTVDGQLVRRSTLFFAPVKPAGAYTLTIQLKRRDRTGAYQVVASGAKPSLTLAPGANTATVTLTPTAQGQLAVSLPKPAPSFTPPPTVSGAAPLTGSVGMAVTFTGTNFATSPASNAVSFNGASAAIDAATTTRVVATVPAGATSGAMTFKTPSWPAVAAGAFTLVTSGTLLGSAFTGAGPQGIALDAAGNLWVANGDGTTVSRILPNNSATGPYPIGATHPFAVEVDGAGTVWVASHTTPGQVVRLTSTGGYLGATAVGGDLLDLLFDPAGNLWVSSYADDSVCKLSSTGALIGSYSLGLDNCPAQLALDGAGNVWVAVFGSNKVFKLASNGSIVDTKIVGTHPSGLKFDAAGNMWATLEGDNAIAKLTPGGVLTTYPCGVTPRGLAIDAFGNPWVCAVGSSQVLKLSPTGAIVGTYWVGGAPNEITFDTNRAVCVTVPSLNKVVRLAL